MGGGDGGERDGGGYGDTVHESLPRFDPKRASRAAVARSDKNAKGSAKAPPWPRFAPGLRAGPAGLPALGRRHGLPRPRLSRLLRRPHGLQPAGGNAAGDRQGGKPYEYFSRAEIDKPWLRTDLLHVPADVPFTGFPDWRDYILRAGSDLGGVFAASVHYWQFGDCVETFREPAADPSTSPLDVLRAFFPELRLVRLRRNNFVAQAISHHVAISTNFWNSRMAGGVAARRVRPRRSL